METGIVRYRIHWRTGRHQTMTDCKAHAKSLPSLKEAQSWFTLLFLLRGMPFIDLARLRKCDLYGDTLIYKRQKTGRIITVNVTPEAMRLIKQLANRNPQSPYLLSILPSNSEIQNGNCFGSQEE